MNTYMSRLLYAYSVAFNSIRRLALKVLHLQWNKSATQLNALTSKIIFKNNFVFAHCVRVCVCLCLCHSSDNFHNNDDDDEVNRVWEYAENVFFFRLFINCTVILWQRITTIIIITIIIKLIALLLLFIWFILSRSCALSFCFNVSYSVRVLSFFIICSLFDLFFSHCCRFTFYWSFYSYHYLCAWKRIYNYSTRNKQRGRMKDRKKTC